MRETHLLNINPEVLRWAREEAGYSTPEISTKLNTGEESYLEWETNGADIPFSTLKDIARAYKRQIAVFFLSQTPKKSIKPTDYRNINLRSARLSSEALLAIRRANRYRDTLLELNGYSYYESRYEWLSVFNTQRNSTTISDEYNTSEIRRLLNYPLEDQLDSKDTNVSYQNWRNCLEEHLGIYVFQFSMPPSEIQGFCYSDFHPYCIVVNSKYHVSSRIFTLFHELGHILQRQSGLCIPDEVTDDQETELECNTFSGRFLLPDDVVIPIFNITDIYKRAKKLKVSSEVYLRRMKSLGLVSERDFFDLLKEIREALTPTKGYAPSTPIQKSLTSRGQSLFNSVVDAAHNNKISYESASDILQLKINHLVNI